MLPQLVPPASPKQFWIGAWGNLARKSLPQDAGVPALSTASHHWPHHLGVGWGPPAGRAQQPWPCGAHSTGSTCRWLQVAQQGWVSSCPSSFSSGLNDRRHWLLRGKWDTARHSQLLSHTQNKKQSVKTIPGLLWNKDVWSQQDFYLLHVPASLSGTPKSHPWPLFLPICPMYLGEAWRAEAEPLTAPRSCCGGR